jgi:hypothetical protein
MILTYVDESGTSYEKKDGGFIDGPYIVYCGFLLPESKYFQLERLYYKTFSEILKIKNFEKTEIHATEIWKKAEANKFFKKKVLNYFEELFQLLIKLKIKIVVGIQDKTIKKNLKKEHKKCIYSFLHILEHVLSEKEEASLLIADENDDNFLKDLFYQKTLWRYNPGKTPEEPLSKYKIESLSCFLLDQIHYSDSKKSLFIQLADQIVFVIRRMLSYYYLDIKNLKPEKNKNPLSAETFDFLSSYITIGNFNDKLNDVAFNDLANLPGGLRAYLIGIRRF